MYTYVKNFFLKETNDEKMSLARRVHTHTAIERTAHKTTNPI